MENNTDKPQEENFQVVDSSSDSDTQGDEYGDENEASTQPDSKQKLQKPKKKGKKAKKSSKARIIFNVSGIPRMLSLTFKIPNMTL